MGARVSIDEPFNWSRLNNRAVELSDEPLIVFANDDMLMSLTAGTFSRGLLSRPEVGAIGARLLYPDCTVQHAGILLGWDGHDVHDGRYEKLTEPGQCARWHVSRSVSAVTGAFMAIRREAFAGAGTFDEAALPLAYADIDLGLKLRAMGPENRVDPAMSRCTISNSRRGVLIISTRRRRRAIAPSGKQWGSAGTLR